MCSSALASAGFILHPSSSVTAQVKEWEPQLQQIVSW